MLRWQPGNGGEMVQATQDILGIAFDKWEPTQEAKNKLQKKKADIEKAKAETIAARKEK